MNPKPRRRENILNCLALAMLSGCSVGQGIFKVDRCADVPSGAIPSSPGSHLCEWQRAQVRSAANDQAAFYQADFIDKSDRLSPAAAQQVTRLVQQGMLGTVPIVLEPSDDPNRDFARTIQLANAFTAAGAPLSPNQILIGHPPALGLEGYRAQQVGRTASRNGNTGGQNVGAGSGFGGMSAGGGLGGFGSGGIF